MATLAKSGYFDVQIELFGPPDAAPEPDLTVRPSGSDG